jgi:hypothetical protein
MQVVSLFQEEVEAFENIERPYTTRVHQDDRRCWRVIRVCARVGRVASGNCDADAYPTLEGADGAIRPSAQAKRQSCRSADRRAADPNTDADANNHSSNDREGVLRRLTVPRRDPSRQSTHK